MQIKASWSDDWTAVPYLRCVQATSKTNPDISEAVLVYEFGTALRPGHEVWTQYSALVIAGNYVRIQIAGLGNWYGTIVDVTTDLTEAPGVQHFTCYGLEWLLTKVALTQSKLVNPDDNSINTLNRALPFNMPRESMGPRSTLDGNMDPDSPLFTSNFYTALRWTALDIVNYLFAYFSPRDKDGTEHVPFELDEESQTESLFWASPPLDPHGRTIKEIVDQLIDPKRALGYRVKVDEGRDGSGKVLLQVFTHAATKIILQSSSLPANAEQTTIALDGDSDVEHFSIRATTAATVDQVVARGARRGSVFTIGYQDGTLLGDWGSAQEEAYEAAASGAADYAGLSTEEKRARNNDYRAHDAFERVFSWFTIPASWDFEVGDGTGTSTTAPAFPAVIAHGPASSSSMTIWRPGLRLESFVPLLSDHDYSGDNVSAGTVENSGPDNSAAEFLAPFALLKIRETPDHYQYVDQIAVAEEAGDLDRGQAWSANLRVRQDDAGLILEVVGGHQHYLAKADFAELPDEEFDEGQYLSFTTMIATVYALADEYADAVYPADADVVAGDIKRTLEIDVPDAFLDWIPENTVVGLDDGQLQTVTTGGWLRDDRDRLQDIARTAWEWYGDNRQTIRVQLKRLDNTVHIGQLITTADGATVNTVVTAVEYDFENATTVIETHYANLDFPLLADML